jgi:hypothetical protein
MNKDYVWFITLTTILILLLVVIYVLKQYKCRNILVRINYIAITILSITFIHYAYCSLIFPLLITPSGKVGWSGGYSRNMIKNLIVAVNSYKAQYGIYPGGDKDGIFNDNCAFFRLMTAKSSNLDEFTYEQRNSNGRIKVFLSGYNRPVYYSYPASGNKGPDGSLHKNVEYYLWTWGYKDTYYDGVFAKYFPSGPECASWSINNWE